MSSFVNIHPCTRTLGIAFYHHSTRRSSSWDCMETRRESSFTWTTFNTSLGSSTLDDCLNYIFRFLSLRCSGQHPNISTNVLCYLLNYQQEPTPASSWKVSIPLNFMKIFIWSWIFLILFLSLILYALIS